MPGEPAEPSPSPRFGMVRGCAAEPARLFHCFEERVPPLIRRNAMTIFRLPALATGCALMFCVTPAFAQAESPPAPPSTQPGAPPAPDMNAMREMMREMMRKMMRGEATGPGDRQRPRMTRPRDRNHGDRMARHHGLQRGGMMRGPGDGRRHAFMHGTGMRILFAVVDSDGDGALSLVEIQEFHGRIFEAVDGNGDGRVDMEEIGSFFHGAPEGDGN